MLLDALIGLGVTVVAATAWHLGYVTGRYQERRSKKNDSATK